MPEYGCGRCGGVPECGRGCCGPGVPEYGCGCCGLWGFACPVTDAVGGRGLVCQSMDAVVWGTACPFADAAGKRGLACQSIDAVAAGLACPRVDAVVWMRLLRALRAELPMLLARGAWNARVSTFQMYCVPQLHLGHATCGHDRRVRTCAWCAPVWFCAVRSGRPT